MTITEAVQRVLKNAQRPMPITDIYTTIVDQGLFTFGAKDPKAVLSRTVRMKSTANSKEPNPLFRRVDQNTYELI